MHWKQSCRSHPPACWKDGMLLFSRWKRFQTTRYESVMNLNCLFQSPFIGRWTLAKKIAVSWQQKAWLCEAESLTVWVFWICVILSQSGKLGDRCQQHFILEREKKEPKKVCGMLWIFFLELHDVEMRTMEPRKGSPSNWTKQCSQMFTSISKMAVAVIFMLCK